jgi:hypothetical protein
MESAASADNIGMYSERCALAARAEIAISPNKITNATNGLVLEILGIRIHPAAVLQTSVRPLAPDEPSVYAPSKPRDRGVTFEGLMEEQQ